MEYKFRDQLGPKKKKIKEQLGTNGKVEGLNYILSLFNTICIQ